VDVDVDGVKEVEGVEKVEGISVEVNDNDVFTGGLREEANRLT
jgi:hypothetical protein